MKNSPDPVFLDFRVLDFEVLDFRVLGRIREKMFESQLNCF